MLRFRLLDLLRAAAALGVVLYHQDFSPAFRDGAPGLHRLLKHGDFGVPMFFVISGYCIAAAADGSRSRGGSASDFLRRRLVRIYPPHWASLAVLAAVPFLVGWLGWRATGEYRPPPGPLATAGWAEWVRVATLTQGFGLEFARPLAEPYRNFAGIYWTLGVEVQFYLVAAVALRLGPAGDRFLAAVSVASVPFLARQDLWLEGLFLPFWPQFLAGLVAFRLVRSGRTAPAVLGTLPARVLFAAGAVGLLAAVPADPLVHLNYCFERAAFAWAFAGVVWLGTAWESAVGAWAAGRPSWRNAPLRAALGLGTISYSLYLLHGPLLNLTAALYRPLFPPDSVAVDAAVLLSVVAACVPFYYCFERPVVGRRATPRRGDTEGIGK